MNTEMKVAIKALKYLDGTDGYIYNANVYINAKLVAHIFDDGYGGGLQIKVSDDVLFAWLETQIEGMTWVSPWDGKVLPMDMDLFLGEMAEDVIIKKKARGRVITRTEDGTLHEWRVKFNSATVEEHQAIFERAGKEGHTVVNHLLGTHTFEAEKTS